MTSSENPGGPSAFVIAGMTFNEPGVEPLGWSSGRIAAVAPVDIEVGLGVTVTVDVVDPATVLALTIEEFGDVADLAAACERGEVIPSLVDQMRGGQRLSAELRLIPKWSRVGLVEGIAQWLLRPLHEGALLLDKAAAYQNTGQTVAAARLVALASPVLEALAEDAEAGLLAEAVVAELVDVATLSAAATETLDWGPAVRDCAARIAESIGISDMEADLVLIQWAEILKGELLAGGALTAGLQAIAPVMVDPAVVGPRVLAWTDSGTAEIKVELTRDGEELVAELSVRLSDFVDEYAYEVEQLAAFIADGASGSLIRTASTSVSDRTVRATLRFADPGIAETQLRFGVFDSDRGPSVIRSRSSDAVDIRTDRLLLDAWSRQRAAMVAQAQSDDALAAETLLDQAKQLVQRALNGLERLDGEDSKARRSAVEAYKARLEQLGTISAAGSEPLLAEMIPLTPEVAD